MFINHKVMFSLFNIKTNQEMGILCGHEGTVTRLAIYEEHMLSAAEDCTVRSVIVPISPVNRRHRVPNIIFNHSVIFIDWLKMILGTRGRPVP